ncbi:MAG: hypothetical protein WDW36_006325 [Sanguina aurantia]
MATQEATSDSNSASAADVEEAVMTALETARDTTTRMDSEDTNTVRLVSALDDLEDELMNMRADVAIATSRAAGAEAASNTAKDQLLRLTADFDNYRRRTAEESLRAKDQVRGDVIKDLLPIVDNFELARTNVKAETEQEIKINNSYQSLYKQFVEMMRVLGVEAVPTVGSPFDPEFHEAIMREPSSEHPEGTVCKEFRKGFAIGEKMLRPAMVAVSRFLGLGPPPGT